jgi:hypothetical protein
MVNYNNSKIYKIEAVNAELNCPIYIGSTTKIKLCNRMTEHRNKYNQFKKGVKNANTTSFILFDKYGIENCKILLIESYNCNTKDELHAREAYHIKNNNCINKLIPNRTRKEHYQANKDRLLQIANENRIKNIDRITDYNRKYIESHKEYKKEKLTCECGCIISRGALYTHNKSLKHAENIKINI